MLCIKVYCMELGIYKGLYLCIRIGFWDSLVMRLACLNYFFIYLGFLYYWKGLKFSIVQKYERFDCKELENWRLKYIVHFRLDLIILVTIKNVIPIYIWHGIAFYVKVGLSLLESNLEFSVLEFVEIHELMGSTVFGVCLWRWTKLTLRAM